MRVAVTGASGFIGGSIASALAGQGHTVHAYGRRATTGLPNYSRWDLTNGPITAPRVDAIVHCAASVGQWGDEATFRTVNVDGTQAVLDSFPGVELFVYMSSSSVYSSSQAKVRLREDAPIGGPSLTLYASTKARGEQVVAQSGRQAVILRPHIVYGPGDTTLLPRVLAARRLGRLPVPGDGTNRVSVTHVFNLVHAVDRALTSPGARGVFNIADLRTPTIDELLRTMLRRHRVPDRLVYLPRPLAWRLAVASEAAARLIRSSHAPLLTRYVVASLADEHTLDLTKARDVLGYDPQWSIDSDAGRAASVDDLLVG